MTEDFRGIGAGPAGGLQGSAPVGVLTAETGPELVTHPSCLSLLEGV